MHIKITTAATPAVAPNGQTPGKPLHASSSFDPNHPYDYSDGFADAFTASKGWGGTEEPAPKPTTEELFPEQTYAEFVALMDEAYAMELIPYCDPAEFEHVTSYCNW